LSPRITAGSDTIFCIAAWIRTAEYVASFVATRAGDQTDFCDGKNLVEGETPSPAVYLKFHFFVKL